MRTFLFILIKEINKSYKTTTKRSDKCFYWSWWFHWINCVQVSNLFAKDEMLEITQNLISVMKKEFPRVPPTFDNLYDYFISRSRKNLHLVLCFSPVGKIFVYSILYISLHLYLFVHIVTYWILCCSIFFLFCHITHA